MPIYRSLSHDPFVNLAIENWLFRHHLKEQPILLLWQNSPCIVIGRAQNPWVECNLASMQQKQIPLVRRQSGGGTVYHDLGNLNISLMFPREHYSVPDNLKFVCDAIASLGINIQPNERNDLVVSYDGNTYKVSGSAFRQTKYHAFHHLTLLVHADLKSLGQYLQTNTTGITAKGVASVKSPVINLQKIQPQLTMDQVQSVLLEKFSDCHNTGSVINVSQTPELNPYYEELTSWEWLYGKTLPFEHRINAQQGDICVQVERGIVVDITSDSIAPESLERVRHAWLNQRYDTIQLTGFF